MKEQVHQDLRQRIITHDLRPGEFLNEKQLMQKYQMGRTPLREVLLQLQAEGFVQMIPRVGTMVAPLDVGEMREIVEIRIELEAIAGRLAAERIQPNQLLRLQEILRQVDNIEGEGPEVVHCLTQYDSDFHAVIYEASGNRRLKKILQELQGLMARFSYHLGFRQSEFLEQFADLRQAAICLEKRDSEGVVRALRQHMTYFIEHVRQNII